MPTNVIMPALGMAQETGKVLQWFRSEGDTVTRGEPLLEVETDKATVELEAPGSGILTQITAAAGESVPVGQVIARILVPGEAAPSGSAPAGVAPAPAAPGSRRVQASPKARRLARERGVDLSPLAGSGPGGAVLASDVPTTVLSTTWRLMAERTVQSWTTVPHFFLLREVDAGALVDRRDWAQRQISAEVTYSDLLVKCVALALREHPRVNARWDGGAIVASAAINVGLAVASDEGLVVPVIHAADGLALQEIARRRGDLVARARDGKLRPDDLRGGTFTISNLGMYAVDAFTAIINPPQAAILAVGRIAQRVVPVDGVPAVRPMLALSLSCDHRVVDGVRGAQFLETLADLIEKPAGLLE